MKSEDTFALIFGVALISITIVGASNPGLRESLDLTRILSIPNPFQKNISKSVYVFEYANDPVMGQYGVVYLEPKCLDQTKSIRKKEFDELLSKGVKITSSIPRKTEVTVGNLYGECVGASYILEGPENLLNNL